MIPASTKWKLPASSLLVLSVMFGVFLPTSSVFANDDAIAVVEQFHELLIDVMRQGDDLDFEQRTARLEGAIEDSFDMVMIGNVVLNRHWDGLDDSQQARFVTTFLRLSAATYASRFDEFNEQQFTTVGTQAMNAGRLLVRTEISGDAMETVRLDYILQQRGEDWRIISAIADGVNDLALKRVEYTAIMNSDGFDALVTELESQVAALATTP